MKVCICNIHVLVYVCVFVCVCVCVCVCSGSGSGYLTLGSNYLDRKSQQHNIAGIMENPVKFLHPICAAHCTYVLRDVGLRTVCIQSN